MRREPDASDPLALPPEVMRRLGYRAVDALVEATTEWSMPPLRRASPAEMRELLHEPAPELPRGAEAALDRLFADVVPYLARLDHPRYMAFIPASGTWPGAIGDFVASALTVYATSWLEGAGPTQLELTILDWFKSWLGLPDDAEGQLTSGGSASNLQALACAREARIGSMRDDLVIYVSDQAHSSVARAARVLGFAPDRVRVIPTDEALRVRPQTLAAAIDADVAQGLFPLAACVSAGTTNAGVVDPLRELAEVCRPRGVWFHVDAAYGGFAALTERGRGLLAGIELADSITLDPHKWLYQSYECGALLVREPGALHRAFAVVPAYLRDIHRGGDGEVNLSDRGLQLSRTSHAFKVWLSIQTFGLAAFREAIDRTIDHGEHAARRLAESACFEVIAPPSLGIVCFRRLFPGVEDERELARLNAALIDDLERREVAFLSSTSLRGRYALRLCPMNHVTTRADVDAVIDALATAAPRPRAGSAPEGTGDPGVRRTWLGLPVGLPGARPRFDQIRQVPLFAGLTEEELTDVAASGRVRTVAAGVRVVRQWDATREFFVVLEGEAIVERDGREVDRIGPMGFFGELGALDWGRGYGYARNATVSTVGPVTLLAFPEGTLQRLMALSRDLAHAVEQAAAERLAG